MRLLGLLLCLLPAAAFAQYQGPAVEACRAYAKREAARDGAMVKDVVFERDGYLLIERYTRKLGSQFVSSILTGNGAVVLDNAPGIELSFICLLASDKQPVFFNWLSRQNANVFVQCTRDGKLRAQPRSCLDTLQRAADDELGQIYAQRFQEANEKGGAVLAAYRKSNDEWREYREAECKRRRDHTPAGFSPDDFQAACMIELTRRRALDMR
ncbi:MAG: lysozyme inhibitor LprI family protein [Betaproteobacteria bacterium]